MNKENQIRNSNSVCIGSSTSQKQQRQVKSKAVIQLRRSQQSFSKDQYSQYSHQELPSEDTLENQNLICQRHSKKIGNFFCKDCCSFNICGKCIVQSHVGHPIINFFQVNQGIQAVKQHLFETIEQTLKKMKSRENEMKNGVSEINLIQKGIQKLKQQVLCTVKSHFREIQKMIEESFQEKSDEAALLSQFQKFNILDNQLTQQIRLVLTDIVDSKIDVLSFTKDMVVKSPPQLPNFPKIKNHFQKQRKMFKEIKAQIQQTTDRIFQKLGRKKKEQSNLKYEKFIFGKSLNNVQPKQSFIKTLRIMDKQNISINALRRNNK